MEQGGHARAVFVDPTGRRHRVVARSAWLLATLMAAYVGLVVVSLLLPPSVSRLTVPGLGQVLPGPAAAPLGQAQGEAQRPEQLLVRSPSPASSPSRSPATRPSRSPRPQASPSPVPVAVAPTTAAPAPVPSATPVRPSPAATRRATTAPTAPPGQSEPPGQASRSPRPRPTPSRGPR